MDFLQLTDKTIVVFGVANRKSVAFYIGALLKTCGAKVIYVVRSQERYESLTKLLAGEEVFICDVEHDEQIQRLRKQIGERHNVVHGLVHSIAFADYSDGPRPFHETDKTVMLRSFDVSCFSLISLCDAFQDMFHPEASVVTISISTTRMANEKYGLMAPIKAALDSSLAFLAKSFSHFSQVRFNAVAPGLLKTSASAGIPGYVDAYLYAEKIIPRKKAVKTEEVANAAAFLLSSRSSGINAQSVIIDAGMSINYFDEDVLKKVTQAP